MKHRTLRILSLLLTLAVLLSNLALVSLAAQKNTGKRHEECTELSSQAEAYYRKNGFDYETYAALKGAANGSCLSAADTELYKALQKLMEETHTFYVSYKGSNGLQEYWPDTDCSATVSAPILFYSDTTGGFNREHVWPKSRASFYQSGGGSDLHHLRPTNTTVNSKRSNYTFANVRDMVSDPDTYSHGGKTVLYFDSSYTENSPQESQDKLGLVEVNDNVKGDVARILLYVYVRWGEKNLFENDPNAKPGSSNDENNGLRVIYDLDTLLQWCENDPVDTWEMSRNDATEAVQGNRNIFIDYPQFAWLLFGRTPANSNPGTCTHTSVSFRAEQPAGCFEAGVAAHYVCELCGGLFADEACTTAVTAEELALPAVGHTWDEGTVTVAPTTDRNGLMTYCCIRCGYAKTALIPPVAEEEDVPCDGGENCPAKSFTDIPGPGDWAHAGIDYAVENGLFNGMTDTTFEPETAMTRGMLVTVLWRYAQSPEEGENTFTDVGAGEWYTKAVAWASHNGIVNGVGNGRFDPNSEITREQMATILYRYAQKYGFDTESTTNLDSFPDSGSISSYAVAAFRWAVAEGLINGSQENGVAYLQPQGDATRAQVATILMRFIENLA